MPQGARTRLSDPLWHPKRIGGVPGIVAVRQGSVNFLARNFRSDPPQLLGASE
jgi:hypothetical protein